jgi:hypothetical protein
MLVLGPWTGPRSKPEFVVAAIEMDEALATAIEPMVGVEFMSMLFKPVGFSRVSKADWLVQSKTDLVSVPVFDCSVLWLQLRSFIRRIWVQIKY